MIEQSFVFGLQIYANYTDQLVSEYKNYLSLTNFLYFIEITMYYIVFIHAIAKQVLDDIKNKIMIMKILQTPKFSNEYSTGLQERNQNLD